MISKDVLKMVMQEQRRRVLERDSGIRRVLLDNILKNINLREIVVISGVRRSGKSTLLVQILKELLKGGVRDFVYINFEDERLDGFTVKDFNLLWEVFLELNNPEKGRIYIFLDEVQEIERWEKWVNRMYEFENVKIFLTGSNARLLSSEISTLLTGRNITYTLTPFSFQEICKVRKFDDTRERAEIRRTLNDYFNYGGFPEIYLKGDKILFGNYTRDIINRDIISGYKIKNVKLFNEFVRYVISSYGRSITFGKLKGIFNLGSVNTAKKYVGFLEDVYLVFAVENYSSSLSEVVRSPRKIYPVDWGLAEYFAAKVTENVGYKAENMVFLELKRRQSANPEISIYYWKNKGEIDFLLKEGLKVTELIQVCWDIENPDTKKRETKALAEGCRKFKLKQGLIITEDFEGEEKIDGKKIIYKPFWKWLLEL